MNYLKRLSTLVTADTWGTMEVGDLPRPLFDKLAGMYNMGRPWTLLGQGSYGSVYQIFGTDTVMKLTHDRSEAIAMQNVAQAGETKTIVKVHNVFALKSKEDAGNVIGYAIIQDKLNKPRLDFQNCALLFKFWGIHTRVTPTLNTKNVEMFEAAYEVVANEYLAQSERPSKESLKVFIKFLYDAAEDLEKLHIMFNDLHSGNIMQDKSGSLKLIDLGISRSPAVTLPDVEAARDVK